MFGRAAILGLLILASWRSAIAETARVSFDLEAATVQIDAAGTHEFALPPDLQLQFDRFREATARGEWTADAARRLGDQLLGSAWETLREYNRWEVRPVSIAPLSILIAPGQERMLRDTHTIWYGIDAEPTRPATSSARQVLVLLPFTPGLDPDDDDPLFFLDEVRRDLGSLALVPRNDSTPLEIRQAIGHDEFRFTILRAAPSVFRELTPTLRTGPSLIWWTRSANELRTNPLDLPATLDVIQAWAHDGRTIAADLWPVDEIQRQPASRIFAQGLHAGDLLPDAVARAKRLIPANQPHRWAGWIYVGPDAPGPPAPRSWWQRLFGR